MAGKDDDKGQYTPEYPNGDNPKPSGQSTFPGQDIYTGWALGAGKNDFFPSKGQQEWIPVILRLKDISALSFARGVNEEGEKFLGPESQLEDWFNGVQVSGLFLREGEGPQESLFLTALVRPRFFDDFLASGESRTNLEKVISSITLGTPQTRASLNLTLFNENEPLEPEALVWPDLSGFPASDGVVVVAVIDDGIPFGHERFWQAERDTRIEYVWLQDGEFNDGVPLQGRELTRSQINDALDQSTVGGSVDEDFFYRHVGAVNFDRDTHKSVARRVSHGAHVMDAATGYDYRDPAQQALAQNRPMICVQLPTDSTADTSGGNLEPYLADAVQYILHRADLIARDRGTGTGPIPIVINFSYGHHRGAHDGSYESVSFIEQQIAARTVPLRVVVPSGNSHLTRTHAEVDFAQMDMDTLFWRVQPDDKTASFLEIWMPLGATSPSRLSVTITPPGNGTAVSISEGDPEVDFGAGSIAHSVDGSSTRGVFLIQLHPTERLSPEPGATAAPVAPSGVWQIKLDKDDPAFDGTVHAWIYRDDTPLGFPIRGRQSYFDHECYQRFDDYGRPIEEDDPNCIIRRAGTINALGTSDAGMIVVGGYYRSEERPWEHSAGGPTNGTRVGPDVMTPSDDSRVHQGQIAAGTHSGSVAALNGTSVAAPQITRWIANGVAGNDLPSRTDLIAFLSKVPLGTPDRTGTGGVDQDDIEGIPVVDLPRFF